MRTLDLIQGSPEWHAHRANHFNASDAPAMMGVSKYKTRDQLIKEMATGITEDVGTHKQRLFDRGHAAEAAVRPKIEALIGEDLYPAAGVSDEHHKLSASFDGIDMAEEVGLEVKLLNADLITQVKAGELTDPHYWVQVEQQILVGKLKRVIFAISNEDASEYYHMEYFPVAGRAEAIIAGWAQIEKDVAEMKRAIAAGELVEPAPLAVAAPIMDLPAVNVNIEGALQVLSNLPEFGTRLRTFIDGLNPAPESDQDFADAENEVKVLKRAEDELEAAEARALSQIAVVDEMRKMKAMLHKLARDTRLAREKLVKDRKEFVRAKIQSDAVAQIEAHRRDTEKFLGGNYLPPIPHDIAGAMKGKKTMASLKDAAATAVAKWKIEADAAAKIINTNLALLDANHDHAFLFNDKKTLALKDPEAVAAIVGQRISAHEAEQRAKVEAAAEAAREKIRREEQAKAEAEAARREAERAEATPPAAAEVAPQAPPATVVPTIIDDQVREIERAAPVAAAPKPSREMPATQQIVNAVALHFGVEPNVAARWLHSLDQAELARVAA